VVGGLCALRDGAGRTLIERVVVVDNGSGDGTGIAAQAAGALVVREARRGYGYACMAGIAASTAADVLLFVDGDHSVLLHDVAAVLAPFECGADLVIGVRVRVLDGAMTLAQRWGNALVCWLCRHIWGMTMSDLGRCARCAARPCWRWAWRTHVRLDGGDAIEGVCTGPSRARSSRLAGVSHRRLEDQRDRARRVRRGRRHVVDGGQVVVAHAARCAEGVSN